MSQASPAQEGLCRIPGFAPSVRGEGIPRWLLSPPTVTPEAVMKPLCCISATLQRDRGISTGVWEGAAQPLCWRSLLCPSAPCQGRGAVEHAPHGPGCPSWAGLPRSTLGQAQPRGAALGGRPAFGSAACPPRRQ